MPIPYVTGAGGGNASSAAAVVRLRAGGTAPAPVQSAFSQGTITPTLVLLPICSTGAVTAPVDGFYIVSAAVQLSQTGILDTDNINCSFGIATTLSVYLHSFNLTINNPFNSEVSTYENGSILLRLSVPATSVFNIRLLCQLANLPSAGTISVSGDLMVQFSAA
jgi:hypothetical protein